MPCTLLDVQYSSARPSAAGTPIRESAPTTAPLSSSAYKRHLPLCRIGACRPLLRKSMNLNVSRFGRQDAFRIATRWIAYVAARAGRVSRETLDR